MNEVRISEIRQTNFSVYVLMFVWYLSHTKNIRESDIVALDKIPYGLCNAKSV